MLACRTIIPIDLLHSLWASDPAIGCVGMRIVLIFILCVSDSVHGLWRSLGEVLCFCYIHFEAWLVYLFVLGSSLISEV